MCTVDCREGNLRGCVQAQASYNEVSTYTLLSRFGNLSSWLLAGGCSTRLLSSVARASRCWTTRQQLGSGPFPKHGPIRSSRYAATMPVQPQRAKQDLETSHMSVKTRFFSAARDLAFARPYRGNTFGIAS